MPHARARAKARRHGLILVGVRVCRLLLDPPAIAAALGIRIRPELRERRLGRQEGRRHFLDELRRDFVDESRRLGRLVFAKHPPARGRREDQAPLRAGDADVAEPPLLFELRLVVGGSRMRKQAFLEARDHHDRELEALSRCASSSSARAHRGSRLPRRRPRAATADRRSRPATVPGASFRTRARPRPAPRGSRCGSRPPRFAPRAGPAGSRSGRAPLPSAIDTDSRAAISVIATIRSRNAASDATARGASSRVSTACTSLTHRESFTATGWSPARSGGVSASVGRSSASSDSMTPLPMPLAGTLITRRRLTLSCGLNTSFRYARASLISFRS